MFAMEETWPDPERRTILSMEELRLERDRALVGQKLGSRVDGAASDEDNRKDERRLPRSALLRKVVR